MKRCFHVHSTIVYNKFVIWALNSHLSRICLHFKFFILIFTLNFYFFSLLIFQFLWHSVWIRAFFFTKNIYFFHGKCSNKRCSLDTILADTDKFMHDMKSSRECSRSFNLTYTSSFLILILHLRVFFSLSSF